MSRLLNKLCHSQESPKKISMFPNHWLCVTRTRNQTRHNICGSLCSITDSRLSLTGKHIQQHCLSLTKEGKHRVFKNSIKKFFLAFSPSVASPAVLSGIKLTKGNLTNIKYDVCKVKCHDRDSNPDLWRTSALPVALSRRITSGLISIVTLFSQSRAWNRAE